MCLQSEERVAAGQIRKSNDPFEMRLAIIRFQANSLLSRERLEFPDRWSQAQPHLQFLPRLIGCKGQIRIKSKAALEIPQAYVTFQSDVVISLANENAFGWRLI